MEDDGIAIQLEVSVYGRAVVGEDLKDHALLLWLRRGDECPGRDFWDNKAGDPIDACLERGSEFLPRKTRARLRACG